MYAKLAIRNIKRSFKDYSIYFLTLVFGVAIFYTFNSIESQTIMMNLSEAEKSAFEMVNVVMSVASVFISAILGFLIIYASNYLIKRRKKEFGIYMTLGMEKGTLSKILFIETLCIGILSLIVGLVVGTLLSQGLSIFTAKLFQVDIVRFKFVFSKSAFIKTLVCFAIIYLIVLLFNSNVIRKVKLIDLLNAAKKNQDIKVRNLWLSVVIFIISITLLGGAYYYVLKMGVAIITSSLFIIVAMGALGTFLFFFALSGFLLKVMQSNKNKYFKNLNMFILRQINSKINTTFISMTFICLMLFVSICTLSGGLGINKSINQGLKYSSQFDATFWNYQGLDIKEELMNKGIDLDSIANSYSEYKLYDNDYSYRDFLTEEAINKTKKYYPVFSNENIPVMKVSEFYSVMEMIGKEQVKLADDKYMVCSDVKDFKKYIMEATKNNTEIVVNGEKLLPAQIESIEVTTYNQMLENNLCTFIVNDEVLNGVEPYNSYLNINYKNSEGDEYLASKFRENNIDDSVYVYYLTKKDLLANSAGFGTMISYLAIYIGSVFLIASAAVLALQQLSEAADNIDRYALLRKIGVDEEMINRSILVQIAIYFMIPLSLAIVHSILGLKISSDIVSVFGDGSIMNYIIVTMIIMIIIYGGYFIAAYNGAKKMLKYC